MIELKFETVKELNDFYIKIFRELKPDSVLFKEDKDFDLFFDAQMAEYKFYLSQILERNELALKFKRKNLQFFEESEELKFDYDMRTEKYMHKMQKKMNKKLFKTFKKECMLARKKGLEFEKKFYEEKNKEFEEERKLSKEQNKKEQKLEQQQKKNEKDNKKQNIVVEVKTIEQPQETKLLEQRSDSDAGTKETN